MQSRISKLLDLFKFGDVAELETKRLRKTPFQVFDCFVIVDVASENKGALEQEFFRLRAPLFSEATPVTMTETFLNSG